LRVNHVNRYFPFRTKIWLVAGLVGFAAAVLFVIFSTGIVGPFGSDSTMIAVLAVGDGERGQLARDTEAGRGEFLLWDFPKRRQIGRPYLGVTYMPITDAVARFHDLGATNGAWITAVERDSPADQAGLRPNDVVMEFDGVPIAANITLVTLQMQRRAGESVTLIVLRQKERRQIYVTLAEMRE